jgi:membrane protein
MRELDLDTHALAFCAQQVLCTAPLVVAISAVLNRETGHGIGPAMVKFFGLRGDSAQAVYRLFTRTSPSISTTALIISMAVAIVFTTSVAAVQQRAFEAIWALPRVVGVRSYLRQLFWAVALVAYSGLVLLVSRTGRSLWGERDHRWVVLAAVVQGALTLLFYWWTQHWLMAGRVSWRALRPGAVAVGIGTAVVFRLTRVIMPSQISWQVHAYGLVGAVFVLSVWLMVLSAVVYIGVLLGSLIAERRFAAHRDASPLTDAGLRSVQLSDPTPAEARHHAERQDVTPLG